jgi:hypothetical protein
MLNIVFMLRTVTNLWDEIIFAIFDACLIIAFAILLQADLQSATKLAPSDKGL